MEIAGNRDRNFYETLKSQFGDLLPTLSVLRQEIPLRNNRSGYEFDFSDKREASTTERLLSVTDAFAANKIRVAIGIRQKSRPGAIRLTTYPSLAAIAVAFANSSADAPSNAAKLASSDLEAIYNGAVTVQIDKKTIFDGLNTSRARFVPETQAGALAEANEWRYEHGQISIEPNLVLSGARANKVTVDVPTFNGMAIEPDNTDFELVLVVELSGYRIQGGSGLVKQ